MISALFGAVSFGFADTVCHEENEQATKDFNQIKLVDGSLIFVQDNVTNRQSILSARLIAEAAIVKFVEGSEITHLEMLTNNERLFLTTEYAVGFISDQVKHHKFEGMEILCSEFFLN